MDRVSRRGILNRKLQEKIVEAKLDELAVRPRGVSRAVRQLSGGNQQKVVLAKWLLLDHTRIFIFDEPTRGVDIATKVEIYRMMADLASAGMAVLLISSEMPEAIGMSDRLLVMRSGRIVAALERSELSMERVFALAVGVETDRMTAVGAMTTATRSPLHDRDPNPPTSAVRPGQRRLCYRHSRPRRVRQRRDGHVPDRAQHREHLTADRHQRLSEPRDAHSRSDRRH